MHDVDPLEPPLTARSEPDATVIRTRAFAEAEYKMSSEQLGQNVATHLVTLAAALDLLADDHQGIADQTDFALTGDTRFAAMWQLAGRCLGLARGMLELLRSGYVIEAAVLSRSLHECNRLLTAVTDPDEKEPVRRWLADTDKGHLRPKDARAAEARADQRRTDAMIAAGETPIPPLAELSKAHYHLLSGDAHHRRRYTQQAVSDPLRTMVRGPHPDPVVRAKAVEWGGHMIEEVILTVGDTMSRFYGRDYAQRRVLDLTIRFNALRRDAPIPSDDESVPT